MISKQNLVRWCYIQLLDGDNFPTKLLFLHKPTLIIMFSKVANKPNRIVLKVIFIIKQKHTDQINLVFENKKKKNYKQIRFFMKVQFLIKEFWFSYQQKNYHSDHYNQKMYFSSQDQNFSAQTQFSEAGQLKKGSYCMIKNQPCKIIEISFAKTGKHGASKAAITGLNIFTNKKLECSMPSDNDIQIPIVSKCEELVANVNQQEQTIDLVLKDGTLKQNIKFPQDKELSERLINLWQQSIQNSSNLYMTLIQACNKQKIVSLRIAKNKKF